MNLYSDYTKEQIETVEVLDFEQVRKIDAVLFNGINPYSDVGIKIFKEYTECNGIQYYARPRESFNIQEGIKLALEAGKTKLWVEDLS